MSRPSSIRSPESDARSNAPPRFARSGQMVECLRQEMLYSDKRARDLLFVAIEQLVAGRSPMMVSQLTREAALLARQLSEGSGFEFENWGTVSRAVVKASLMAEALLTPEGRPVPIGIGAQASLVGGLREEYRDRTEAFLLAFLIQRLGDVTTKDHTALAHALFRQFDPRIKREDLEDRVVILLARLADRVALSGEAYEFHAFGQA